MISKELGDLIKYFEYNGSVIQEKDTQISTDSENGLNQKIFALQIIQILPYQACN